jgi:hypothetical protein
MLENFDCKKKGLVDFQDPNFPSHLYLTFNINIHNKNEYVRFEKSDQEVQSAKDIRG